LRKTEGRNNENFAAVPGDGEESVSCIGHLVLFNQFDEHK